MSQKHLILAITLIAVQVVWRSTAFAQTHVIPVYQYHNWAPFYFKEADHQVGFAPVFVEQLNRFITQSRPDLSIRFELKPVSRPQLNQLLKNGEQGLVLWANALWFKRLVDVSYFVSSSPIYWDNEAVLSMKQRPIEYKGPDSLISKRVAGIEGFYYHGIDQWVAKDQIERINSNSDRLNLKRLIAGKVDAVLITQTVYNYIRPDFSDESFYQAAKPQDAYSRHILMTPKYHELSELLNFYISSLPNNQIWVKNIKSYGLGDLVIPFYLDLDELNNFSIE